MIDSKDFFVKLIHEGHDAILFYYNSIEHLIKDTPSFNVNNIRKFRDIRVAMQSDIICRYRKVLQLLSNSWSPVYQISSIGHLQGNDRSSITHDVQSVVVARRFANLIQQLNIVIHELPFK